MKYEKKRTSRKAWTVDGITFISFQVAIGGVYQAESEDGRITIRRNPYRTTHSACVDGNLIGRMFHTETSAIARAIVAMKRLDRDKAA